MGLGGNYEERSRSAPVVAEGERRVATRQALFYLGKALLYLFRCWAIPCHVMVDNEALASSQVRHQFVEEHMLGASSCVSLGFHLKAVVGVDENDIAPCSRL